MMRFSDPHPRPHQLLKNDFYLLTHAEYILRTTLLPNFYPDNLQHSSCKHVLSIGVENSVDPDQMALSEAS